MKRMSNLAKSQLQVGQKLHGHHGIYDLLKPLSSHQKNVWLGIDSAGRQVTVKTAPPTQFRNELKALKLFNGHASVRQLVDEIHDPPSLVLQYLDENL